MDLTEAGNILIVDLSVDFVKVLDISHQLQYGQIIIIEFYSV